MTTPPTTTPDGEHGKPTDAETAAARAAMKRRAEERAYPLIKPESDRVRDLSSTELIQAFYSHEFASLAPLRAELERKTAQIENLLKPMRNKLVEERDALREELQAVKEERDALKQDVDFFTKDKANLEAAFISKEERAHKAEERAAKAEVALLFQGKELAQAKYDFPMLHNTVTALQSDLAAARTELEGKTSLLVKCHRHLCTEIQALTLNESAKSGSQSLLREISVVLDAARSALSGKGGEA